MYSLLQNVHSVNCLQKTFWFWLENNKIFIFRGQKGNSELLLWRLELSRNLSKNINVTALHWEISNATKRQVFIWELSRHQTAICIHPTNCSILHPCPCTWFMCHFAAPQHSDFHDVINSQISLSYCVCAYVHVWSWPESWSHSIVQSWFAFLATQILVLLFYFPWPFLGSLQIFILTISCNKSFCS